MVASRHPRSRSVGTRPLHRQIGRRPVSRRSEPGSPVGGCGGRHPQLRLVVDNTARRPGNDSLAPAGAMIAGGATGLEPGVPWSLATELEAGESQSLATELEAGVPRSLATELGAWLRASVLLAGARWRLARQRWINRYGNVGLLDRVGHLVPVVGLVAVVVFGALLSIRLAQESSSTEGLAGFVGPVPTVASVATTTSDSATATATATASDVGLSAGSGSSVVVVHPGDSLWSIAVSRYPERDPREVVAAFVKANGASGIRSGQQLIVPAVLLDG